MSDSRDPDANDAATVDMAAVESGADVGDEAVEESLGAWGATAEAPNWEGIGEGGAESGSSERGDASPQEAESAEPDPEAELPVASASESAPEPEAELPVASASESAPEPEAELPVASASESAPEPEVATRRKIPEPAIRPGRSRRPTSFGLPAVTERSSDLRSTISDSLKTQAPRPLREPAAAAEPAAPASQPGPAQDPPAAAPAPTPPTPPTSATPATPATPATSATSATSAMISDDPGRVTPPSAPPPAPATPSSTPAPDAGEQGPSIVEKIRTLTSERPEVAVGAAFVGGLLLATILKRLARR